ncbi:MAG: hypothetical protein A4E52_01665 [Pelotomaculum sp. PtaB.Bin013]|uniref:GPR1/FUN34/yaaH family protein n=1 Tax=Pelotomaculum isophthalicicum JI TaxID=947010 RepID=A0A9X4H733_9FIRM|nr:hypothetical protein [Pelotomaculum isophthalicicum]MDF9409653.1 hypothetical protein [Pelotomaculum isophthalicicum JI]OPX85217.1 MAG: hypothetical protein A4E52_01665 [Pelotomaculum sp. PtaB.Bin013]
MSEKSHSWATPSPAGLVALAMACFTFFALLTGKITPASSGLMGIWLLGGFAVQIIVGIVELKEGNILAGNIFTFFSAFFMLVTGLEFIFKFFASVNGWKIDAHVDGWGWLPLAAAVTLWAPAYLKSPKCLFGVVISLTPALWIISFMDMGVWPHEMAPIAGWLAFSGGTFGVYTSAAVILNTAFGRSILPMGAPFIKPQPVSNPVSGSKSA